MYICCICVYCIIMVMVIIIMIIIIMIIIIIIIPLLRDGLVQVLGLIDTDRKCPDTRPLTMTFWVGIYNTDSIR